MMQIVDSVSLCVCVCVCECVCARAKISDSLQFTTSSLRHTNMGLTWNLEVILKASDPNVNYNGDRKKAQLTPQKIQAITTTMVRRNAASYFYSNLICHDDIKALFAG